MLAVAGFDPLFWLDAAIAAGYGVAGFELLRECVTVIVRGTDGWV